ncbi:hypothetical protein CGRA01v4_03292 [Colletotrichum graminicola]|nr:hypothetical protein CGRA01v4_03292 [Colletotrichum graminicola]
MKAKSSCGFLTLLSCFFLSCARLVSCLFSVFLFHYQPYKKPPLKHFTSSAGRFLIQPYAYYLVSKPRGSSPLPSRSSRITHNTFRLPEPTNNMVNCYIFALAGLAAQVSALPLNINLGAYSPALVVGDGEISFGGKSDVSQLMNVLEGAAVNAAQGAGQAAGNGAGQGAGRAAPATAAPAAAPETPNQEIQQNQQAQQSVADIQGGATPVTAISSDNQINEAQAIAALQGMGKEIAPRVQLSKSHTAGEKRDLAGFDRALKYAEVALTKGPKIDLGTGEGGSGVGIKVDNQQGGAAQAGAGGQRAAASLKARADEAQQPPRRRAKVTTMYVRSGVPEGVEMASDKLVARNPSAPVAQVVPATSNNVVKRAQEELASRGVSGSAIDTVNLNVSGEGVTMTFVETEADDVDEQQ